MEERILNMGYCEICGKYGITERHHVFYGTANRKQSEKYGLVCDLCPDCHRGKQGVHRNRNIDMELKRKKQKEFELHHSREEFRSIFGKSYL